MGKGAKIAIGCGIAVIVLAVGVMVAVFGAAWWAKGKVEELAGDTARVRELQAKANGQEFTPPANGVIDEDRLEAFLEIRQRVYSAYAKHKDMIEKAGKKDRADLSDLTGAFSMINEIRLAQAEAQAEVGMSTDEYAFMVQQVYKTMWAVQVAEQTGGKSVSEATRDSMEQMREQLEQSRGQEGMPDESRAALEQALQQLQTQAEEAQRMAGQMDVPPENIELFRKYEEEIRKYSMTGLEVIGL